MRGARKGQTRERENLSRLKRHSVLCFQRVRLCSEWQLVSIRNGTSIGGASGHTSGVGAGGGGKASRRSQVRGRQGLHSLFSLDACPMRTPSRRRPGWKHRDSGPSMPWYKERAQHTVSEISALVHRTAVIGPGGSWKGKATAAPNRAYVLIDLMIKDPKKEVQRWRESREWIPSGLHF